MQVSFELRAFWNRLNNINILFLILPGNTEDYHEMLCDIAKKIKKTRIIALGYSMGGNLVTKYIGENRENRPANIIAAVSVSQGYSALE